MDVAWLEKYAPKRLEDIVGMDSVVEKVLEWVESPRKGLLAYGPPGVGKTAVAHLVAKKLDLEIVEMNASDFRTKSGVNERLLNAAMQQSLFGKGKLLLVDEVDGLAGRSDWGGAAAVANLIRKSPYPVYLTCNDNWSNTIKILKGNVIEVFFSRPRTSSIVGILERIAASESIEIERNVLLQIASNRDVRSAINDFETVAFGKKSVTEEDLGSLGDRDRDKNIFEALRDIFKATSAEQARSATEGLKKKPEELMLWIDENIPLEYGSADAVKAYEALSRADVFAGRIYRRQDWKLLKHVINLSTIGVAMAKSQPLRGFVKYRPPTYLSMMGRTRFTRATRNSLLAKIGEACHCSRKVAASYLPVLAAMAGKGKTPFEMDERELAIVRPAR